jgi:hypothetical protein
VLHFDLADSPKWDSWAIILQQTLKFRFAAVVVMRFRAFAGRPLVSHQYLHRLRTLSNDLEAQASYPLESRFRGVLPHCCARACLNFRFSGYLMSVQAP